MSDRINPSTMVPTYGAGRIIMIFFVFITFLLPAIARRSGEAGGDESDETQSACSGMIIVNLPFESCIIALLAF